MNTQSDAAQDRSPKTSIAVVVADKASVEAAEKAGISAIYCNDIAAVEAKDLAADLEGADTAVILPPAGATKEFVQSIWALTRALRELGMPATYRLCHEDKRKKLTGLAGWIKLDGAGVVRKILEQAAADAIQRTKRKADGGYVAVGFDGDRSACGFADDIASRFYPCGLSQGL